MTEKLSSDHFVITYNNGVVMNLEPDKKNPEMKSVPASNYLSMFIQDEIESFCNSHNIPKNLWKKYGFITKTQAREYVCIGFQIKFLFINIVDGIKISNSVIRCL